MYTRSYNDAAGDIIIPEHYGGTSFTQSAENDIARSEEIGVGKNPWEKEEIHTASENESKETIEASSFALKLPFSGFLSNIFKNESFSLQKIGKEELLILATAAFLFLSKEGDKECAIMLILLLFLK